MLYVYECFACMYVYVAHACCLQRLEEGVRSPGTGVKDGCEPPSFSWDPKPGPLQDQQVLLTTKPTLLPLIFSANTPIGSKYWLS